MGNNDTGLFLIRLGIGVLFVIAGFGKITGILGPGIAAFSGMVFGSVLVAWLVALGELAGGLSLLTGFKHKWGAIVLGIIMIGAIFIASVPAFDGSNPMTVIGLFSNLALLGGIAGLYFTGPGSIKVGK